MLYFCRRVRQICINSTILIFHSTRTATEHAACTKQRMKKREDDEGLDGSLMYVKTWSKLTCGSSELYVSNLNSSKEFLFYLLKINVSTSEGVWYNNIVVGERILGEKMKNVSRDAKLSKCYANHSIWATTEK